jgi:3-hydroxybutyryl-CoA dehydrogenase
VSDLAGLRVGVVGAGLMGHGIAQVFALAGAEVSVSDPDPAALASLGERIGANLDSLGLDRGALDRVAAAPGLAEVASGADLVIEAAPEDLELKRRVFAQLEREAPAEAILATNTSVIAIGDVAAGAATPERIVGTHFWNPPYLINLVEVIEAEATAAATVARTIEILGDAGKTPVHVRRDVPGFVGNRLQHAMWREALALIDEGVCDAETVDLVAREGFGARLATIGPVENADLVGLDLTESVHAYLLPHLDRSTEPAAGLRERVERGELGAKSGRGYFEWPEGAAAATRERLIAHLRNAAAGPDRQRGGSPVMGPTSGRGEI